MRTVWKDREVKEKTSSETCIELDGVVFSKRGLLGLHRVIIMDPENNITNNFLDM